MCVTGQGWAASVASALRTVKNTNAVQQSDSVAEWNHQRWRTESGAGCFGWCTVLSTGIFGWSISVTGELLIHDHRDQQNISPARQNTFMPSKKMKLLYYCTRTRSKIRERFEFRPLGSRWRHCASVLLSWCMTHLLLPGGRNLKSGRNLERVRVGNQKLRNMSQ